MGEHGNPDADSERGYIVHASERTRGGNTELDLIGRLENGETFAVVERRFRPFFHVREEDLPRVRGLMPRLRGETNVAASDRRTIDGAVTAMLATRTTAAARELRDALHREGIRTYEADVKLSAQYLMDRRIRGTARIRGAWRPGRRVSRIYENPELAPASFRPSLSILSLDIETDPKAQTVYAAALAFRAATASAGAPKTPGRDLSEVLLVGERVEGARSFPTEKALLEELRQRILALDPDVLTGWNVVDFDFRVLSRRFAALGVGFDIGRSDTPGRFLDREGGGESGVRWKKSVVIVEGRQVIDGMWLARTAGLALEDYRLETVAQAILGRGKRIERFPGETATQSIERLYEKDPASLAAYCLEDARLVLEILDKEGLMDLAVAKSLLIGTALDQTLASVVSFEILYMEHLHARGFVAPTLGIDQAPLERSPGGGIITPRAGLFEGVLVFDFKSLYPSLMRTFNLDPLSHIPRGVESPPDFITAPNGERFSRKPGIIPEILDRFFESREQARREGNRAAVYAYKIVMNSFYGVLGTDGCRFASSALASSITTFGQHILYWARDLVKSKGYDVIYGDTDSLFVLVGKEHGADTRELAGLGEELARFVNDELQRYVQSTYGIRSRLELEFEAIYKRFFLPPLRTPGAGGGEAAGEDEEQEGRGRAKGYAGLRAAMKEEKETETLDVVGMEAVRHDWTWLAGDLQRELLERVFHGERALEIGERARRILRDLRAGKMDGRLAYRKYLRKPVEAYTKSSPPHARAAALLPPEERTGLIRYVWTTEGPQPESRRTAPLDYEHYVQKQVRPIVESIAPYIDLSTEDLFTAGGQLGLF
jgi:DNA polymerase-2